MGASSPRKGPCSPIYNATALVALIQVGAKTSATYSTVLGCPAEIVPLQNPYDLKVGGSLDVRVLVNGNAVANQYVQYGGRTASEGRVLRKAFARMRKALRASHLIAPAPT